MAHARWVDEPRMSDTAYSGWTSRKTIGSISPPWPCSGEPGRSIASSTVLRKRHSTTGWIAVNCSLMKDSTRECSSSTLRFTATEKSGSTSWSTSRVLRSPGWGEPRLSMPISSRW